MGKNGDKKIHLLMLEDNSADAERILQELRKEYDISYKRVYIAEDMKEALEEQTWDIIIADYKMPRFNALDGLQILRRSGLDIPYIVSSGTIGEDVAVQAMKAGVHDYLLKDNLTRLIPAVARELQDAEDRRRRRKAEEELRKSEEKYRNIFENISEGFAYHEMVYEKSKPVDYVFLEANRAFEEQTGLNAADIIGKKVTEVLPGIEKDPADWIGRYGAVASGGGGIRFEQYSKPIGKWYAVSAYSPKPGFFCTLFLDITERKQVEDELRKSEEFIRAVMDNLPIGVAVNSVDPNVTFAYMNDNFPKIYRTTREALDEEDTFWDAVYEDPKFRKHIRKKVLDDCACGDPERMHWEDVPVTRKEEHTSFICARNTPVPGKKLMISTVWDVTDRKRVEQERERLNDELTRKNKELEQLLYVTTHDLRSPLVNVQGFSKELGHSVTELTGLIPGHVLQGDTAEKLWKLINEDIPESLQYIQTSIVKMDTLLTGLLRLSRLGRDALTITNLDMDKLVADAVAVHEFTIKKTNTQLALSKLPACRGDAPQISQVFSNLVDNAMKYMDPDRRGKISISGEKKETESVYCIEDNGMGIAPEHQENIFEIFHRLEPKGSEGEGLGLTIVKRALERQGGTIWVESEEGKGSRFYVSLPAG